jgi:hypothetical protein
MRKADYWFQPSIHLTKLHPSHVRSGSLTAARPCPRHVYFTPKAAATVTERRVRSEPTTDIAKLGGNQSGGARDPFAPVFGWFAQGSDTSDRGQNTAERKIGL